MSYTIVYDRMFLKTTRGVIPMLLAGSNNCTMFRNGQEIRERSWFVPRREFIEQSGEAILTRVNELIPDDPDDQVWKSGGKWQSSRQVRKWYANGGKLAATLEEIRALNPSVSVRCSLRRYEDAGSYMSKEVMCEWCNSTYKLEKWLDDVAEKTAGTNEAEWLVDVGFDTITPLNKPPVRKWQNQPVVLRKNGTRGYYAYDIRVTPGSGWSVSYTTDIDKATRFASIDEAMSKAGSIMRRLGDMRIVKYVPKTSMNFAITKKTMEKDSIVFVEQATRKYIHYTHDSNQAKRFKSAAEAKRWIDARRSRYSPDVLNALSVHRLLQ